jgi:hypothetical protein
MAKATTIRMTLTDKDVATLAAGDVVAYDIEVNGRPYWLAVGPVSERLRKLEARFDEHGHLRRGRRT